MDEFLNFEFFYLIQYLNENLKKSKHQIFIKCVMEFELNLTFFLIGIGGNVKILKYIHSQLIEQFEKVQNLQNLMLI